MDYVTKEEFIQYKESVERRLKQNSEKIEEIGSNLSSIDKNTAVTKQKVEQIFDSIKNIEKSVEKYDETTNERIDKVKERVARLEQEPAERMSQYKKAFATTAISSIVTFVIGAILAVLFTK